MDTDPGSGQKSSRSANYQVWGSRQSPAVSVRVTTHPGTAKRRTHRPLGFLPGRISIFV